jgi:hypothetical protein
MLVVFAFSITPAIVFHNWLVNHSDTFNTQAQAKGDQLGIQTFNCKCDHVVAESPFTEPAVVMLADPLPAFSLHKTALRVPYTSSPFFLFSLRGPPAV